MIITSSSSSSSSSRSPDTQILELLWNLAHLPQLSREMVELALEAHSSILVESFHTKEAEKRTYISKCVEDIRKVRRDGQGSFRGAHAVWPAWE